MGVPFYEVSDHCVEQYKSIYGACTDAVARLIDALCARKGCQEKGASSRIASSVADELQLYSGDLERFGYLASAKFRAARMVLDAGIHTRGMGYEEAIAFLGQQSTRSTGEVRGGINRYISWPGQAPSYMIGNLEILRLREQARAALGEPFDVREFHDQVLTRGNFTLPLLRELVQEWISRSR